MKINNLSEHNCIINRYLAEMRDWVYCAVFCFFVSPGLMSLFFPASACIEPSMFGHCS